MLLWPQDSCIGEGVDVTETELERERERELNNIDSFYYAIP